MKNGVLFFKKKWYLTPKKDELYRSTDEFPLLDVDETDGECDSSGEEAYG